MSGRASTDQPACAALSLSLGEDPIGTAPHHDRYLVLEVPTPWRHEGWHSMGVPRGYRETWQRAIARGMSVRPIAVAPDYAPSRNDRLRLIHVRRPKAPFTEYAREEFFVPLALVVPLTAAILDGTDLALFEPYRVPEEGQRDLLVCTHGSLDACCGSLGYPLYRNLRERASALDGVRVWRASHFGGHRFAPTVLDLPLAQYWAHLTADELDVFDRARALDPARKRRYRGWGGLARPMTQVVEREALFRMGWRSASLRRTVRVLAERPDGRAELRIELDGADGAVAYEATVETTGSVRVALGCAEDSADARQYRLLRFDEARATSGGLE